MLEVIAKSDHRNFTNASTNECKYGNWLQSNTLRRAGVRGNDLNLLAILRLVLAQIGSCRDTPYSQKMGEIADFLGVAVLEGKTKLLSR
jgi:hypothetical protein